MYNIYIYIYIYIYTHTHKYRIIEKDGRDLKPLKLKKYLTDLHVWRLKMFRRVRSFRLTLVNL